MTQDYNEFDTNSKTENVRNQYKLSKYNYHYHNKDNFIIYNTKSGAILTGEIIDFNIEKFFANITKFYEHEYFDTLVECGIVQHFKVDEIEELKSEYENSRENIISVTIVPTVSCNFRCPYCYVNTMPSIENEIMSRDIAMALLSFIRKEVVKKKIKMCKILWFGGEPTLAIDFIENFMENLTQMSLELGFLTSSTIVTNGYLLTKENFARLYNSKVRIFQVTLDGNNKNHNEFRIMEDGNGTFEVIYENLLEISKNFKEEEFSFSLRANFLKGSMPAMEELLNLFYDSLGKDKRYTLSFRPIIDFKSSMTDMVYSKQEARVLEAELLQKMLDKDKTTLKEQNPMFQLLPTPIDRWCRIKKDKFIINPKGKLYYCNSCISDKNASIGYLSNEGNIHLNENHISWLYNVFEDKKSPCLQCKRLPICMGGCSLERKEMGKYTCHWNDKYIMSALKYLNETK